MLFPSISFREIVHINSIRGAINLFDAYSAYGHISVHFILEIPNFFNIVPMKTFFQKRSSLTK